MNSRGENIKGLVMLETVEKLGPRTTADIVFDVLHDEIMSLKLMPGARISEAEVAGRLGVSRQPVRDAFNRLGNLNLLRIRPQRATQVCGFDIKKIESARFIRLSIELETLKRAKAIWDKGAEQQLEANLKLQRTALDAEKVSEFHELDYDFHKLIFDIGGFGLAFDTVLQCKLQVDRLCVLSLAREEEASRVLEDHEQIAFHLANSDFGDLEAVCRRHLSRLDDAIRDIHEKHLNYFE